MLVIAGEADRIRGECWSVCVNHRRKMRVAGECPAAAFVGRQFAHRVCVRPIVVKEKLRCSEQPEKVMKVVLGEECAWCPRQVMRGARGGGAPAASGMKFSVHNWQAQEARGRSARPARYSPRPAISAKTGMRGAYVLQYARRRRRKVRCYRWKSG